METFLEYTINKKSEKIKFCEDRKKGAQKILSEANAKGGVSKLTAWHFSAKLPEYDECLKAIKDEKPPEFFKQKMRGLSQELMNITVQKKFQEVMGKLEVWGEIYLVLKQNSIY
jgi:hypothetical protein